MNKKIKSRLAIACFALAFLPMTFVSAQQKPKAWPVPAEYKSKANPSKGSASAVKEGKEAYDAKCASCHGKKGLGDGPKAKTLDTPSGDFTAASFQSQTDGELFYKTKMGREDMPAYKGKMTDDEIWSTVSFLRTFKK